MNQAQLASMKLALQVISKPEESEAYINLLSGSELTANHCRALITACYRNTASDKKDVDELAEHFFNRYDFNDKVKVCGEGQLQFI